MHTYQEILISGILHILPIFSFLRHRMAVKPLSVLAPSHVESHDGHFLAELESRGLVILFQGPYLCLCYECVQRSL